MLALLLLAVPDVDGLLAGLLGITGVALAAAASHLGDGHLLGNAAQMCLVHAPALVAIHAAGERLRTGNAASLLLGLGTVAQTMLPPGYWAHDPSLDGFYKLDRDKARALLTEAGYPDGFELKYYSNADQSSQQRAEIIMEQLRQVGIRCVLTTGSNADMFQRFMVQGMTAGSVKG